MAVVDRGLEEENKTWLMFLQGKWQPKMYARRLWKLKTGKKL